MQGSFLDEYNRLEAYANEIRTTNPGSDVVINLSKYAMEQGKKILRMYICFNAMKLLERSLNLKNGDNITFMSHMQKGLLNEVENVLPLSNHRHIEANWMKRFRTGEMKKLMWWAAWCTYEEDFKDQLNALGALLEEAAKDMFKFPPQKLCRIYFDIASEEGSISSLKRKRGITEGVQQDEEVFDVNSSAPQLTQEGFESDISTPRQRYESFVPTRELESDPALRPHTIFEELKRLKMRQNQQTRFANRVITFEGDHRGVSEATDLPYLPTKVTWKGKEAMTSNHLEREREKKVGKLKTKKANGRSQI
ncbi:hypothetical protein RDI58_017757 [Solanum bulbocastanum]|uniref:Uncharacterized protein n=1 Tax=Solanum bulbocastanum TaxID=147425 RepID=A0AAN8Y9H5_SOLBU